jgi:uncharacterized oligopeptide transporter (OPT) family protein
VVTTTPLFAAVTLILQRFAAVIFVTMLVGLVYVLLFLTPLLAMFGPGYKPKKQITEDTPIARVVTDMLLHSKGVRFVVVTVISILALVRLPACLPCLRASVHVACVGCTDGACLCRWSFQARVRASRPEALSAS